MKVTKRGWAGALVAGILVSGVGATQVQATTSAAAPSTNTAASTTLAKSVVTPIAVWGHGRTLAGGPWAAVLATYGVTDGYVVDNKFGPGDTTGWHAHPGPSLIFVVSGTVTNYDSDAPGCAPRSYPAGSSLVDAGGKDVHMLRNEGTTPAETIAVQFIPSGQPRRIEEPEPANCHV